MGAFNGGWGNGEIANSSSPSSRQQPVHQFARGKRRIAVKRSLWRRKAWALLAFCGARDGRWWCARCQCAVWERMDGDEGALRLLSRCWSRLRRWRWARRVCGSFLPCQATCWMREGLGGKKKGMSGVFICDVRVHHNYSQNIDRNGRLEFWDGEHWYWEVAMGRGCQLNWVWNTANFWIGIWILPWFWTRRYGHEGVWRVRLGVVRQVTKWWCVPGTSQAHGQRA